MFARSLARSLASTSRSLSTIYSPHRIRATIFTASCRHYSAPLFTNGRASRVLSALACATSDILLPLTVPRTGYALVPSLSFLTVFRSLQRRGVSRALYLVSAVKSYQEQENLVVNYLSLTFHPLSLSLTHSFSLQPLSLSSPHFWLQSFWRDKAHRSYAIRRGGPGG